MMTDILEENGYDIRNDYFNQTTDLLTVQGLFDKQLYPKGTKVTFNNIDGLDYDRDCAAYVGITSDMELTVKSCLVGGLMSFYEFEEVPSRHNTVMFDLVSDDLVSVPEIEFEMTDYERAYIWLTERVVDSSDENEKLLISFIADKLYAYESCSE